MSFSLTINKVFVAFTDNKKMLIEISLKTRTYNLGLHCLIKEREKFKKHIFFVWVIL